MSFPRQDKIAGLFVFFCVFVFCFFCVCFFFNDILMSHFAPDMSKIFT